MDQHLIASLFVLAVRGSGHMQWTPTLVVWAVFGGIVLLYGLRRNLAGAISFALGMYVARVLVHIVPEIALPFSPAASQFLTFSVVALLATWLISRHAVRKVLKHVDGKWRQSMPFAVVIAGLFISSVLSFAPATLLDTLAPLQLHYFADPSWVSIWLVAPVVFIIFFLGRQKD